MTFVVPRNSSGESAAAFYLFTLLRIEGNIPAPFIVKLSLMACSKCVRIHNKIETAKDETTQAP
jgi:hypothetical protein